MQNIVKSFKHLLLPPFLIQHLIDCWTARRILENIGLLTSKLIHWKYGSTRNHTEAIVSRHLLQIQNFYASLT